LLLNQIVPQNIVLLSHWFTYRPQEF
jgi:hypothetical protein